MVLKITSSLARTLYVHTYMHKSRTCGAFRARGICIFHVQSQLQMAVLACCVLPAGSLPLSRGKSQVIPRVSRGKHARGFYLTCELYCMSQVVVANCGLCSHTVSIRTTLVLLVLRLWQKVSCIALTFKD